LFLTVLLFFIITIVYDKGDERLSKGIEAKSYENNVIRFEARLFSSHIYYNLKSKKRISRLLENYITDDMYDKYMLKMIIQIYYMGDFYNQYHAERIIRDSSEIRDRDKDGIIEFIKNISCKRSVTKACEQISKYTAQRYLQKLQEIGINPILIPKSTGFTYIDNPLKGFYAKL
jgi:hypothetical protein